MDAVEMRIHGVGGSTPEALLGESSADDVIAGDADCGVWQRRADSTVRWRYRRNYFRLTDHIGQDVLPDSPLSGLDVPLLDTTTSESAPEIVLPTLGETAPRGSTSSGSA
jgi:hypothetical protein